MLINLFYSSTFSPDTILRVIGDFGRSWNKSNLRFGLYFI